MVLALTLFLAFSLSAQKIDMAKVPAPVITAFEKKYPGNIAKWEREDGNYEANFKEAGNSMSMIIDPNGAILETEMDIKISALPPSALTYVKEHYKGKTVKEAAKITKADGSITYEAEVAGTDVIFDAGGKFIKESKEK